MTTIDDLAIVGQPRAPIEWGLRAVVDNIDYGQRIVTVVAVPYEEAAQVLYRGEVWNEVFTRGAFSSIMEKPNRIRVNRDHDKSRTVGKIMQFIPERQDGLIAEVRVAKTELGDETLSLAAEDCLSASIGFGVLPSDQILDRQARTRRVNAAILDHLSFVESPAYAGAGIENVRAGETIAAATLPPLHTPNLDQAISEMSDLLAWTNARLNRQ
jgi:HK97 family phage prohead protease